MAKPWLDYTQQAELLTARGMVIANIDEATDFLSEVGYYRLSGYFRVKAIKVCLYFSCFSCVSSQLWHKERVLILVSKAFEHLKMGSTRAHPTSQCLPLFL